MATAPPPTHFMAAFYGWGSATSRLQNSFGTKLKKNLGRIFFKKMQCQISPLFCCTRYCPYSLNLVNVLEINNFGRDYSHLNNLFQGY